MQITVCVFVTREEIQDWLAQQTTRFELHFALVRYWPEFEVIPLPDWQQFKEQEQPAQIREVWMDLRPIRHLCKGQMDCCSKNQDRLALQLPDMWQGGLRPGVLGSLSEDETRLKTWRSIIRFFRNRTKTGMWVLNRMMKARGESKQMRYSPGIEELHRKGLKLWPFAGENEVFIDMPVIGEPKAAADGGRDPGS